jgi:hypothetical protein
MSLQRTGQSRSITLLVAALLSAALLGAAGALAMDAAAAKPRPSPKPTPTPTSTPTPTPTSSPTPASSCAVTGSVTPSPNGSVDANFLNDVAPISADDIWAVGSYGTPFEHWDGTRWTLVADPNTGHGNQFFGVAAVASDDVWAVGTTIAEFNFGAALAEHWDGERWSVVEGTRFGTTSRLSDVAALAANDVWAVGNYSSEATNHWPQPLVEHWDGTAWSVVESPALGTSSELHGVAALAPDDIWAVGFSYATRYETLILHWDGTSWTRVPSPNVGRYGNGLWGVSAVGPDDVWAVGEGNNGSVSLTLHWNGSDWSVVPSPNSTNEYNSVLDVSTSSSDDVWAVGYSLFMVPVGEDFEYHQRALLMHWDGTSWSLFESAAPNTSDNRRNGVGTLPGGEAWIVGRHSAFEGSLIERYRCQ